MTQSRENNPPEEAAPEGAEQVEGAEGASVTDETADAASGGASPEGARDEASEVLSADPSGPPERRVKRWRFWLRAALLLLFAPVVMGAIAAVLMIDKEITAPSWMVRDVERRAKTALAGGSIAFEDVKIVIGSDLHPRLILRDSVLRDADGFVLAQVPRIDGLLSPRGALDGRVLVQEVDLTGTQIALNRQSDGQIALAFQGGGAQVGVADDFIGLLELVDQVFDGPALEALETVRADGVIINYTDARAQRSWVVDGGRLALDVSAEDLSFRADIALLSGRSYVTSAEFTYDSPRGSPCGGDWRPNHRCGRA